jgi:hypothetical protein
MGATVNSLLPRKKAINAEVPKEIKKRGNSIFFLMPLSRS